MSSRNGHGRRPVALVVEDNIDTLHSIVRVLTAAGWEVWEARSLAEARAWLARRPDVVVTDWALDGETGDQVLTAVRAAWPDVGVVLYSGDPPDSGERKRFDAFVPKPGERNELATACESLRHGRLRRA